VVELTRHVFEVLRSDEDFVLYRGRGENDESQVLVLSPLAEYPAPEILSWLEKRIFGSGYIPMEFAHIAQVAGAEVTALHRGDRVLKSFKPEVIESTHRSR
jgi:Pyridine nucleotide-disulphide oxidoreductase